VDVAYKTNTAREFFLFLTFFNNILFLTFYGFYFHGIARLVAPAVVARQRRCAAARQRGADVGGSVAPNAVARQMLLVAPGVLARQGCSATPASLAAQNGRQIKASYFIL